MQLFQKTSKAGWGQALFFFGTVIGLSITPEQSNTFVEQFIIAVSAITQLVGIVLAVYGQWDRKDMKWFLFRK